MVDPDAVAVGSPEGVGFGQAVGSDLDHELMASALLGDSPVYAQD